MYVRAVSPGHWLCLAMFLTLSGVAAAGARDDVLAQSLAHWRFADAPATLTPVGAIELGVDPAGERIQRGQTIARVNSGYFDAGHELHVEGDALTVYLRARDPRGAWSYGLFSKRGAHRIVQFNLFSVDLPNTPGPDIGFELHTYAGFAQISFPVSAIDSAAWHDLIGRYDGRKLTLICDGKVMATAVWKGGPVTQNSEHVLIGAETDNDKVVRPFTGEMEEAALWSRALTDAEVAAVCRKERLMPDTNFVEPYCSPIHFRPATGRLADTIPFFWKGDYHIFYLRALDKVPWEHIVSNDLVNWTELPTALLSDGAPTSADGLHMFTGSVSEKDGVFHIWYTGWNPDNPAGREWLMDATSTDLVTWTKHPERGFRADGVHYENTDFRDPFVFWNDAERCYWMVVCARSAKTSKPVQGVLKSKDIVHWEQSDPLILEPPLGDGTPECPDLFQIGDTHYLIHSPSAGTTDMRYASALQGPYRIPETGAIDTMIIYAAKRMYDGKRHILTGWIRDLGGDKDDGEAMWGGDQSVPREVYAGPGGMLYFRPVPEATALFTKVVASLETAPELARPVLRTDIDLAGTEKPGTIVTPDNYMLTCRVQLDPQAELTIVMREQLASDSGYRLILSPAKQEATIRGKKFNYPRRVRLDASAPITVQAFVQGTIIECFINDAYAFSCRAYEFRSGRLGFRATGGAAKILALDVKTSG